MSGFILTHVYSGQPGLTAARFMRLRLARLYPTHISALVLLAALLPWRLIVYAGPDRDATFAALLAKLLLVDSLVPNVPIQYAWNGVSWSLSTEMFFYLAFPFLLAGFQTNWPWKLAGAAILSAIAYTLASAAGWAIEPTRANVPNLYLLSYASPLTRGFDFVLGMASYLLWRRFVRASLLSRTAWTLMETLALAGVAAWIFVGCAALARTAGNAWSLWALSSGGSWIFALTIVAFANARGAISQSLCARNWVWLGEISFSFYMLHQIIMRAFIYYWGETAWFSVVFAVCLIAAAANRQWIEGPCRRLILSTPARPAQKSSTAQARA